MKPGTVVLYIVIRLAIFATTTVLLILLGFTPWLAAVLGAVIALCISVIFLARPRREISQGLAGRKQTRDVDAEHEDAFGE